MKYGPLDVVERDVGCHYRGKVGRDRCNLLMDVRNECVRAPAPDFFDKVGLDAVEVKGHGATGA